MSNLPKIDKPVFTLLVPSLKREVKFRPFVVKEEKILLIAQQSGQEKDIVMAIKQVLNNCVQEKIDIDKLATFDLEYLFLKLRSRSVNNEIQVTYRDNEDEKTYDFTIDLDKVEMLKEKEGVSNNIKITEDGIGIVMRYPSVDILDNVPADATATDLVEYMIRSCIESIYDEENVYPAADYTDAELTEFLDSLDIESFNKIREFFDSLPTMYYKIEYENSMGSKRVIELTTLSDFFTWE